jgi:hypothetical protein
MSKDDIEVYLDSSSDGTSYIESLTKSWRLFAQLVTCDHYLMKKLEEVISLELDLAILGAEKAKSEILKKKDNKLVPIK